MSRGGWAKTATVRALTTDATKRTSERKRLHARNDGEQLTKLAHPSAPVPAARVAARLPAAAVPQPTEGAEHDYRYSAIRRDWWRWWTEFEQPGRCARHHPG